MIFLALDFETTGPDPKTDRVIEFGYMLYSTELRRALDSDGKLVHTDKPITPTITKITHIIPKAVERFGYDEDYALDAILDVAQTAGAYLGYNIRRFDFPLLKAWAARQNKEVPDKLVVDVFQDLPWTVPVGKLNHTAADHGIINPFPHSALADAITTLLIADKYTPTLLVDRAKSPVVVLRSYQNRNDNDSVKQAPFKFRWNPDRKIWWRLAKEQDVEEIVKEAPFRIEIEKQWTPEELEG